MPRTFRTHIAVSLTLTASCLAFYLSPAFSQSAPTPVHSKSTAIPERKPDGTWESLKPAQQKILAPLESDWDYMLPDSRKKWIQVANIYPKMSAQDQERLQSRMTSWSNLSQKDRRIARENYLSSLKFPAEKKVEAWSAYQKLSDEQKKKLAEMELKKKPNAINAPTLQQHTIKQETTPTPPAPRPRAVPAEVTPPASTSTEAQ
ncbi:DUF3106 domain-containing protein [Polynucleobacter sp. MWH-Braz-FAM2G]|uniref:DUF3106 domain-containing protein n=1 Tax=Polynucleobacter sp. MWH-Braz-FAM2G TaxID=1855883 RepID=UPI001BFE2621|nr:DUF3106 domain-containing protein [Polynucleobacter sp. MWH-Braz-FAM2G]QWD89895.1 DUF3106 domain-containing protein [Polynucleobacter sp. MWH-Braz-FAM2G]